MNYEYKMIQIPPKVLASKKSSILGVGVEEGNEAARYLQMVVNETAENGWEFYRVDSLGVDIKPGCLGGSTTTNTYHVITFRKPK